MHWFAVICQVLPPSVPASSHPSLDYNHLATGYWWWWAERQDFQNHSQPAVCDGGLQTLPNCLFGHWFAVTCFFTISCLMLVLCTSSDINMFWLKFLKHTRTIWKSVGAEPLLLHFERNQIRMPPGRLPLEVFQAHPTGRRPWRRPRTQWRDYISHLACECLGIPPGAPGKCCWGAGCQGEMEFSAATQIWTQINFIHPANGWIWTSSDKTPALAIFMKGFITLLWQC